MTFQQLTYVVEIAKCGSMNKAAHKLFLSQSALSSSVRELEEELGIEMFVRSNRGVDFTPDGTEFLSYAQSLLNQKNRIESLYGESRRATAPVRFSVSTQRYPFTEDAFLRMLQKTEENRYSFSILEDDMDAVIDDVYDHRADVGVIFLTELTEKIIRKLLASRNLDFHPIASVSPSVYLRKGHPLTARKELSEADLLDYPYVSFAHEEGMASDFSEEYQMVWLKKPAKSIYVNNRSSMMDVLASTDAFTTGSGLLAEHLSPDNVVTLPLAGKTNMEIGWITPQGSKLTPETEQFLTYLKESVLESISYTDKKRAIQQ